VPDGAAPEWLIDHVFAISQIAGVAIARRMRRVVVPMRPQDATVAMAAAGGDPYSYADHAGEDGA